MRFTLAIAAVAAKKDSPDCPESTEVFSYSERVPAAAGFMQLSACQQNNIPGVVCSPSDESNIMFATGMNGDEDLGQDIIMKGEPFHYNQQATQDWDPSAWPVEAVNPHDQDLPLPYLSNQRYVTPKTWVPGQDGGSPYSGLETDHTDDW
jgi:hypothetical protein